MCQEKWNDAVSELRNIPDDNPHLVGLKKKVFLSWARSATSSEERKRLAQNGLDVKVHSDLMHNIPILVLSTRLAALAEDVRSFQDLIHRVKEINVALAEMLEREEDSVSYWEDDMFIK